MVKLGNMTIMVGLGITAFLLLYIVFNMRKSGEEDFKGQEFFRVFMFFFAIACLLLIAKVGIDDKDFCSWNVANSTTSGSTTTYNYDYECSTNSKTTSTTFYKVSTYIYVLFFLYVLSYYIYIGIRMVFKWGRDGGNFK